MSTVTKELKSYVDEVEKDFGAEMFESLSSKENFLFDIAFLKNSLKRRIGGLLREYGIGEYGDRFCDDLYNILKGNAPESEHDLIY